MNQDRDSKTNLNDDFNKPANFIRDLISNDVRSGKYPQIVTRFPPEPNGYLHIGHAKSICLNFSIAREFSGKCHLRLDDTNPKNEEQEYIDAIKEDVRWLGFDWDDKIFYTSDYFDQLYEWAEFLIVNKKAYIDDLNIKEIREYRGTLKEPGKHSPYRNRSVDENLSLFRDMRAGKFEEGEKVLRAKIDMTAGNINLRDPVIYRIVHADHPRTGSKWCIYPNYDFAHGQSDAIENITHSLCTLEFEDHRPLYDWFIQNLPVPSKPRQHEFSRLNLTYTVLSKRNLITLVDGKYVSGWDDPRMPTLSGYRRRGYPAEAIRDFINRIGVSKSNVTVEVESLEACVRENLNKTAVRRMGVLDPLKIVIENYPENKTEDLEVLNSPNNPKAGQRKIKFCREIYIDKDDFMENPTKKFYRLSPGNEVRLRYAYVIKCLEIVKDSRNEILEIRCSYDRETKGRNPSDGRKIKGTIHWVSVPHAIQAEVRHYSHLFNKIIPGEKGDIFDDINPDSLNVKTNCRLEENLRHAKAGETFQFERLGYFCVDKDTSENSLIFNQTIGLRDSWSKKERKN